MELTPMEKAIDQAEELLRIAGEHVCWQTHTRDCKACGCVEAARSRLTPFAADLPSEWQEFLAEGRTDGL